MEQSQLKVKNITLLLGLFVFVYLTTSVLVRAFGLCDRPSFTLQVSAFSDLMCLPHIQTSLAPSPTPKLTAIPSTSPSPQIDNSQAQYYVKFTIDGVNKVFVGSQRGGIPYAQPVFTMAHTGVTTQETQIEADDGQPFAKGESMLITLPINDATGYFTYESGGKTLYEGDCAMTITGFTGLTGYLKGKGVCDALSDLQDKTSVTKKLTDVEFNVKMLGGLHAIE